MKNLCIGLTIELLGAGLTMAFGIGCLFGQKLWQILLFFIGIIMLFVGYFITMS